MLIQSPEANSLVLSLLLASYDTRVVRPPEFTSPYWLSLLVDRSPEGWADPECSFMMVPSLPFSFSTSWVCCALSPLPVYVCTVPLAWIQFRSRPVPRDTCHPPFQKTLCFLGPDSKPLPPERLPQPSHLDYFCLSTLKALCWNSHCKVYFMLCYITLRICMYFPSLAPKI